MHTDSGMTGISLSGCMPYMTVASLEMSDEPVICIMFISLLAISCSRTKGERSILPDGMVLADGDIVFRRGTGLMSHTVVAADGGWYSHVGIVVDSAGVKMIVHAVPNEPVFPGHLHNRVD